MQKSLLILSFLRFISNFRSFESKIKKIILAISELPNPL